MRRRPPSSRPSWSLAGVRDLNGDGTSDVVWYNATTGKVDLWKIANGQWAGSVDIGSHPLGWQPAGIGDLNGDGTNDLLWHNPSTGNVDLWKLVNGQWAGSVDIGSHPLGYQVAGIADFDQDGTSDVLWYNPDWRQRQSPRLVPFRQAVVAVRDAAMDQCGEHHGAGGFFAGRGPAGGVGQYRGHDGWPRSGLRRCAFGQLSRSSADWRRRL